MYSDFISSSRRANKLWEGMNPTYSTCYELNNRTCMRKMLSIKQKRNLKITYLLALKKSFRKLISGKTNQSIKNHECRRSTNLASSSQPFNGEIAEGKLNIFRIVVLSYFTSEEISPGIFAFISTKFFNE